MKQKITRVLASLLALVCFGMLFLPLSDVNFFVSQAATFRGKNIWTNGPEAIYGRNRNWMYKWTDGWQMTFCIAPRNHMGSTITAEARRTNIDDDEIPYIKSKEDYEKLAMICTWYDTNGSIHADNATYAAAQSAIWAIMEDGWESADSVASMVSGHVPGTYEKWQKLKAYVEEEGNGGNGIPEWCFASAYSGKPQQMVLENGVWTASLDISSAPQLATLNWTFEGDSTGWNKSVADGKMTFTYSGNSVQPMTLSAELPHELSGFAKNTTSLNLYIPKGDRSQIQAMISAGPFQAKLYVHLAFGPATEEPALPEVVIYRHTETFDAHYTFDVRKYCAETGKPLEGAIFQILEAFDEEQVEGNLESEQMTPKPSAWEDFKVCGEARTDEAGSFSHTDEKQYEYSKTYCDGHPEPEYMEVPEACEGEDHSDEIAAVEEANEALQAQWEALVEACEAETDFHGMEPGEGLEMMLKDRDETYEQFINLNYDYTVQEIQARYGYIRHGLHPEDEKIPVVRMNSSEAGANHEIIEKEVVINKEVGVPAEDEEDTNKTDRKFEAIRTDENVEPKKSTSMGDQEDKTNPQGVRLLDTITSGITGDKRRATSSNATRDRTVNNNEYVIRKATNSDALPRESEGQNINDPNTSIETDKIKPIITFASVGESVNARAFQERTRQTAATGEDDDWEHGGEVSLPEPIEDDVPWIEPAGTTDQIGYTFLIRDHRTEGEIHINKRDLELQRGESKGYDSYGESQGDGTLEGAVYGLYAAEDIIHPDGKTGVVYPKGTLTAIATTNLKGDASFLAYTEECGTWKIGGQIWVGHPLILGQYYVKEIARSEGYELSVYGADQPISNLHTDKAEADVTGRADVTTAMAHPIDMHDGSWLEFDVAYQNTFQGFDLLVSGYPEGAMFYRSRMKETADGERVVTGSRLVPTGEYEKASQGEYRLDGEGNYMPLLDEQGNVVWDMEHPVSRVHYVTRRLNYYPDTIPTVQVDPVKWADSGQADMEYVKEEANSMLEETGYRRLDPETGQDAPWTIVELSGSTNHELVEGILGWFSANSFWDSGAVHKVWKEGGRYKAIVFHDYIRLSGTCIYESASNQVYVRIPVQVAGMGERHMFLPYHKSQLTIKGGYTSVPLMRQVSGEIPFPEKMENYIEPVYMPRYQQYQEGDYRLNGEGKQIPVYRTEFIYEEKRETTSDYELVPLEASYDSGTKAYTIHVENTVDWNATDHVVIETFRAVTGLKNIEFNGNSMFYSDYLTGIKGAGASAFVRLEDREGSYIRPARLTYPGQISLLQDGEGNPLEGTRQYPVVLQERIIKQSVKVTKDMIAGAGKKAEGESGGMLPGMDNFRFKIYLKSNLQRLYCSKEGNIVWTDRWGNVVDVDTYKAAIPTIVPDLYTQPGQGALLETIQVQMEDGDSLREVETYNYDKFFDAIRVANEDKWDDHKPTYTSYRPIGNERNRIRDAIENAKISDNIRQFSIDWYLDEEVEILRRKGVGSSSENKMAYGDQLYDEALFHAIERAEGYLKPFFRYDLDELYAILWDSEAAGGRDKDKATLSADQKDGEQYYQISAYLPYGTYLITEQQPQYAKLRDLPNRHYQIDRPKEIVLPSVYSDYEAACQYPEGMSGYYVYDSNMTAEDMTQRYLIRFHEEGRKVNAHNRSGDFVIYPYGLDTDRKRNDNGTISISEDAEAADGVEFFGGIATKENPSGRYYKDQVDTMTGIHTAFDGKYSSILVPWSMVMPEDEKTDSQPEASGESSYQGYAYAKFRNRSYGARLRLEKLDSETHENLLHDGAIFSIYIADRDDAPYGTGNVRFYEKDTMISGSKEFLESMGASDITPMARGKTLADILYQGRRGAEDSRGPGNQYTGVVPRGTPICKETDRIFMPNTCGTRIGEFQAFTTTGNHQMGNRYEDQNAGYLETPRPLEAGTYVLAEVKAPAGYTRTKPMAVEIYSDKISYYKEGNRQDRVVATIYEKQIENPSENQNKPEDYEDLARIYVENAPIKLSIEKWKESSTGTANTTKDKTVTWKINGRIDGTFAQIGGNKDYEYAYLHGTYQGYGWKKGTLEYLQALKERGEDVAIVYHGTLFSGYGYITRTLETANEENPYVPGARMTLYEGMELNPSGDEGDYTYEGLMITRAMDQTVTRMYVQKGYGGTRTEFLPKIKEDRVTWTSQAVEREDTDILYYDLGGLDVFNRQTIDGREILYGYDRNHERIPLSLLENDRTNQTKTDQEYSIFVFQGGAPYLEIAGGDFTKISYSSMEKQFTGGFAKLKRDTNGNYTFGEGAVLYHLDRDGNRDSLVDPDTGMAYVLEETKGAGGKRKQRIMVWPVTIARDGYGTVTARDKITTCRIATAEENEASKQSDEYPESGYITGSWRAEKGEASHTSSTGRKNLKGQNMNGEPIFIDNTGSFEKDMDPVLDQHGLVMYYSGNHGSYHAQTLLYDRNGDLIRRKEQDLLDDYRQAAYIIKDEGVILHRFGESYILENTWISGETTPNDPFHHQMTDGQADILKRVPAGTYILEEVEAPKGYTKGFPSGITVAETNRIQTGGMVDYTTKVLIGKVHGTSRYTYKILDMQSKDGRGGWKQIGTATEGKGAYSQTQLSGVCLSLYQTERDKKATDKPIARWDTTDKPYYMERIPAGEYILEETRTPEGLVKGSPMKIKVENTREVQNFMVYNDHTKIEIEKYSLDGSKKTLVNHAQFHLYEALTDSTGQVVLKNGVPQYKEGLPVDSWESSDASEYESFIPAFEEMYQNYGTEGTSVSWDDHGVNRTATLTSLTQISPAIAGGKDSHFPTTAQLTYCTEEGKEIRITVYESFTFEYQFDYHLLPQAGPYGVSYLSVEGIRRVDGLTAGKTYILVETQAPKGYAKAEPVVIYVENIADIQRYGILNQEGALLISKTGESGTCQLAGAQMALYRAADDGNLVQDEAHLVAKWISGSDGGYTELEELNRQIPDGCRKGDLRLHAIKGLPDGVYYLAELQSPDYYTLMKPVKIQYQQQEMIQVVRAGNTPAKGQLEITKADAEGKPLSGAVFQLSAYQEHDLKTPVYTKTCGEDGGTLTITGLPIGEVKEDGSITPYVYTLREIAPPDGYKIGIAAYTFRFPPGQNGNSFKPGQTANKEIHITNEKTKIVIQKKDFDFLGDKNGEGAFVEGARLAVYKVTGRDWEQNYTYDSSAPLITWETRKDDPSKVLEGLYAGQTYALVELQAPKGYDYMSPIFFTISKDGRKIAKIGDCKTAITVELQEGRENLEISESDGINAVTVQGRYGVRVEMSVKDSKGKELAAWTAGKDGYFLPKRDDLPEGEICTITETTVYSDGSREVTGRMTRPIIWQDGGFWIPDRMVKQVMLELSWGDGERIQTFAPKESDSLFRIENNLAPPNPEIHMYNREGRIGDGLNPDQEVFNRITCVNTCGHISDMRLSVKAGQGTRIVDARGSKEKDSQWVYEFQDVKPMESRSVVVITQLDSNCLESLITAELAMEPEGKKAKIATTDKRQPILQKNKLTIFHELIGSGQSLYQEEESNFKIFLYGKDGEELRGTYPYRGSRSGYLRSGDQLPLRGNQYITIDPGKFHPDIGYHVVRLEDGKNVTFWNTEGQTGRGACAVFSRKVTDTRERIRFIRGEHYLLKEITEYSDNARHTSSQIQFALNGEGAVDTITGFDKQIQITISKEGISGEKVPGATLQLTDEQGQILDQWISGTEPHKISVNLEREATYILHEKEAPDGYGYSQDILFTVWKEGVVQKVVMTDRRTKVLLRKTDITGEKEIPGAAMKILDLDGNEIESWISTETPHEITGKLTAGKEYILHEEYAPKGYAYTEDVRFFVPRDGELVQVSMKDRPTHVSVRKTDITGEKEIPGAELQIIGSDGIVVEQWKSEETPHDIIGKLEAGKEYTLHEHYAPMGYAYEEDIPFTVSRDGTVDKVVMKDQPTHVSVKKTDITGEKEVPGAVLQILDEKGQVVEAWISQSDSHEITGKLEAGKTYTLHEEHAPSGYGYCWDVTFTVSLDGRIDQVTMKDDRTKLEIVKIDVSSGLPLEGARLQLLTENGQVVEEWVSTSKAHTIYGKLIAGAEYKIKEVSAPPGYRMLPQCIPVSIPEDGSLVSIVVENQKAPDRHPEETPKVPQKPEQPDIPLEPDSPKTVKIGTVFAVYKTRLSGEGKYTFAGFRKLWSPQTGDERNTSFILVCILAGLSIIGMIGLRKKDKKSGKIPMALLCLLSFSLGMPLTSRAEDIVQNSDTEILVTWDPFIQNVEVPKQPAEVYVYDGREYILKSCQIIPVMIQERTKEVKDTIVYEAVEQVDRLPHQARIQVTDEDSGQETEVMLPALEAEFKNWRWEEGFQFPITVQQYDAGLFYLGDITVTAGEQQPFLEYKKELLDLIDVNPNFYSIEMTQWTSDPWTGEDGLVYRQAMALGQKYVADCSVVYGGMAVIPAVSANAWQAVYVEKVTGIQKENLAEPESDLQPEEDDKITGSWIQSVKKILRITIGILLFLILAVFLIWMMKRQLEKKKHCERYTKEKDKNIKNTQR